MPWFKLDCKFFLDDDIVDLPIVTRFAVAAVIGYVKANGNRGMVRASAAEIGRFASVPTKEIEAALRHKMFSVNGKSIQVVNWQEFQDDPTHAERQQRYRERKGDVTLVTPVTVTDVCDGERRGEETSSSSSSRDENLDGKEKAVKHAIQEIQALFKQRCPRAAAPRDAIRACLNEYTKETIIEAIKDNCNFHTKHFSAVAHWLKDQPKRASPLFQPKPTSCEIEAL